MKKNIILLCICIICSLSILSMATTWAEAMQGISTVENRETQLLKKEIGQRTYENIRRRNSLAQPRATSVKSYASCSLIQPKKP